MDLFKVTKVIFNDFLLDFKTLFYSIIGCKTICMSFHAYFFLLLSLDSCLSCSSLTISCPQSQNRETWYSLHWKVELSSYRFDSNWLKNKMKVEWLHALIYGPLLFPRKIRSNYAQLDKNRHNDNDQHHQPSWLLLKKRAVNVTVMKMRKNGC